MFDLILFNSRGSFISCLSPKNGNIFKGGGISFSRSDKFSVSLKRKKHWKWRFSDDPKNTVFHAPFFKSVFNVFLEANLLIHRNLFSLLFLPFFNFCSFHLILIPRENFILFLSQFFPPNKTCVLTQGVEWIMLGVGGGEVYYLMIAFMLVGWVRVFDIYVLLYESNLSNKVKKPKKYTYSCCAYI